MLREMNGKAPLPPDGGWRYLFEHFNSKVEKSVRMLSLRSDETILRMQDEATKVYLLMSGSVTVQNEHQDGTVYAYATFEAPSLFGEFEAFAGSTYYRGTLVCQTDCQLAAMTREAYLAWMRSDAEALFCRMQQITRELVNQAGSERSFLFLSGSERLMACLANAYRNRQQNGICLLYSTHQQLADEIGVCVKTVQRSLKSLKEQGLVTIAGRKLRIDGTQYARMQQLMEHTHNNPDLEG